MCSRTGLVSDRRRRSGPIATIGTAVLGHRSATSQVIPARARTSSTRSRTALFSGPDIPSGTTTTRAGQVDLRGVGSDRASGLAEQDETHREHCRQ